MVIGDWLPVVTHWSLYRLHGFFMMKGAYMVLDILLKLALYRLHGFFMMKGAYMVLDILLKLADLVSRALSLVTAILLFINNRPGRGKH